MDVNWYTSEKIVEEVLRAQRAKAEMVRLAAVAPRYRMRRRIGNLLIKVGHAMARSSEDGVGRSRAATT
jgi:hypothetical protein